MVYASPYTAFESAVFNKRNKIGPLKPWFVKQMCFIWEYFHVNNDNQVKNKLHLLIIDFLKKKTDDDDL